MLFSASYANLETIVPGIDMNPADINPGGPEPTSATGFTDEPWSGGTTVSINGPQWFAGLSKRSVTPPTGLLQSISQITVTYDIRPSQTASLFAQLHETDLIIVDANGNRYNGSCQKNNEEGGMWQIVNAQGNWVDTGFKPGLFTPDVWTPVSVVYRVNWQALTLSVIGITDGTTPFLIPAALQNVPAVKNSGWQPNLLDIQIQDTLIKAGSYTRDMKNIGISLQ
jgi:hypothetical protein